LVKDNLTYTWIVQDKKNGTFLNVNGSNGILANGSNLNITANKLNASSEYIVTCSAIGYAS